ncbi:hypothetical protein LINPERHAP1_LOCUS14600 [Linum perenne]
MVPRKSGTILFTASSVTETYGNAPHPYTASKAAVVGLMKNLCGIGGARDPGELDFTGWGSDADGDELNGDGSEGDTGVGIGEGELERDGSG